MIFIGHAQQQLIWREAARGRQQLEARRAAQGRAAPRRAQRVRESAMDVDGGNAPHHYGEVKKSEHGETLLDDPTDESMLGNGLDDEDAEGDGCSSDNETVMDQPDVYAVHRILDEREGSDGSHEFLIKWKGYKASQNTWEPEANILNKKLIARFRADRAEKKLRRERASEGRVAKPRTAAATSASLFEEVSALSAQYRIEDLAGEMELHFAVLSAWLKRKPISNKQRLMVEKRARTWLQGRREHAIVSNRGQDERVDTDCEGMLGDAAGNGGGGEGLGREKGDAQMLAQGDVEVDAAVKAEKGAQQCVVPAAVTNLDGSVNVVGAATPATDAVTKAVATAVAAVIAKHVAAQPLASAEEQKQPASVRAASSDIRSFMGPRPGPPTAGSASAQQGRSSGARVAAAARESGAPKGSACAAVCTRRSANASP
eukprot:6179713-Pleurochrysis_carterae.AAC.2